MNKEMTQEERLTTLVEAFKRDSSHYKNIPTPNDTEGKRTLLRSLMNIRMPKNLDKEIIDLQDEYLQERIKENGIIQLTEIPIIKNGMYLARRHYKTCR